MIYLQSLAGLRHLQRAVEEGLIEIVSVVTASIHRNTDEVLNLLREIEAGVRGTTMGFMYVDVIVVGAGMANHLTGTVDAYLRHTLKLDRPVVIGVAFEGKTKKSTEAAKLSIEEVPGTQVVFSDAQGFFVGGNGFLRACEYAIRGELPEITIPKPRDVQQRSLQAAIDEAARRIAAA